MEQTNIILLLVNACILFSFVLLQFYTDEVAGNLNGGPLIFSHVTMV